MPGSAGPVEARDPRNRFVNPLQACRRTQRIGNLAPFLLEGCLRKPSTLAVDLGLVPGLRAPSWNEERH